MQLFERGALVASAVLGLSVAGWMVLHGYKAPTCPPVVPIPVTVVVPGAAAPPIAAGTPVLPPEYTDDAVVADPDGTCSADTGDLVANVRGWIAGRGGVLIDPQRGIEYLHGNVDTGGDGPYPKRFGAEAKRACGDEAIWLRTFMVDQLRWHAPLTCCNGTCTYTGGEYAPNGTIKLEKRHDATTDSDDWVIVSWNEAYTATLSQAWIDESNAALAKAVKKMPARCVETPGVPFE
jgi:hypothetical protein